MNAVNDDPGIESHFGEVLAAYLEAVDAGWAPDRRAFLARYPQWQHELEAFFAAQDEVHHLAEPFRPFTPSPKVETPTGDWVAVRDANITVSEPTAAATDDPYLSFGDFEMLQEIARGGMGVVYRARQISLNRVVALKMVLAGRFASAAELQRFRNEAEAAALMDHSGIVPIYQVGEYKGQPWFIMKLIEGGSLAEHMQRFERGSRAAVSLLIEVARAVHYAHQRGILHRDLKPANILLDEHGHPLVTDFGLAKRVEADAALTDSHAIVGTPSYMAPEQAMGKRGGLTTAADTYSLGAILFEMLTGRPPFKADNPLETLLLLRERPPAPPRSLNPKIDRDLELICLKCLEKEPARRYITAADLADDLERWLRGEPIVCRPVGTAERLLKWTRHHPSLAALAGLAALVLVLVCVSMGVLWQLGETKRAWQEEARRAQEAETAGDKAKMERHRAEEQTLLAESALYTNRVLLAHSELLNNEVARADQILDECPERLRRNWEWRYVRRLCPKVQHILKGHTAEVYSVAFSPDSQRLASASWDETVMLWDARTGQEALTLKGHKGHVFSVAFSPDGQRLASAGWGGVKVWDARTGQETLTLKRRSGGSSYVAFSPDGQRLASAHWDGRIKVWDTRTGQEALLFNGHTSEIYSVAFSPDGQRLATASGDHTAKVWDSRTGQKAFELNGHAGKVYSVAFSPDGQYLATASEDRMVKVWDSQTGQETLTLKGHTDQIRCVAFSPDGRRLASAGWDGRVKKWDTRTGQEVITFKGHGEGVYSVAFSPDGQRLATASQDKTVEVWDTRAGPETIALKAHGGEATSVAFSPDSHRLASAGWDGTAKVWDTRTGQEVLTLKGHTSGVASVAFSPNGQRLASGSGDQTVKVWDARTGQEILTLTGHGGEVYSVAFSPDGQRLASAGWDRSVKVWDARTGQETRTLKGHSSGVYSVAFSPDGQRLASASQDRTVKVWDAHTFQELLTLKGHLGGVTCVAFSPDGQRLATASQDKTVRIWDTGTGQELLTLKVAHTHQIYSVTFSPNSQRLATASEDHTVKLWDTRTGQETLTLQGNTEQIVCVVFNSDGTRLAGASSDGTIKIWGATPLIEDRKEAK